MVESRRDVAFLAIWHQAVLIKKAGHVLADVGTAPLFVGVPELGFLGIHVEIQAALDGLNDAEQFVSAKLVWCFHVGAHIREGVPYLQSDKPVPLTVL